MKIYLLLFCTGILILSACTSGRQSFQRGDYDAAVFQAVDRLRANPDNEKAAATLREAYPYAENRHLEYINNYKKSTGYSFRWEEIYYEYVALNKLYDEISRCPACMRMVSSKNYLAEERDAVEKAAAARYDQAVELLATRDRDKALEAYNYFHMSEEMIPGFRDASDKMEEAKFAATLKVVVEPVAVYHQDLELSGEFFQNKIYEYLQENYVSEYIRFFTPQEAEALNIEYPDQLVKLKFDEYRLGQEYIKEKSEQVSKDSIVIGQVEIMEFGKKVKKDVFGDVKATVTVFQKSITSEGILDFKIIDPYTNKVLTQEKLPGSFEWTSEWGYFNGDERALSEKHKKIIKLKEGPPPPPQELFVAFTQPVYNQLIKKINYFYGGY